MGPLLSLGKNQPKSWILVECNDTLRHLQSSRNVFHTAVPLLLLPLRDGAGGVGAHSQKHDLASQSWSALNIDSSDCTAKFPLAVLHSHHPLLVHLQQQAVEMPECRTLRFLFDAQRCPGPSDPEIQTWKLVCAMAGVRLFLKTCPKPPPNVSV